MASENGHSGNGNASVNYTVKELLTQAQKRADERHELTLKAISDLTTKVDSIDARAKALETDQTRRIAIGGFSNRVAAVVAAFGVLIINIPAMLVAAGKL